MVEPHAAAPQGVADLDVAAQSCSGPCARGSKAPPRALVSSAASSSPKDAAMGGSARAAFEAWFHVLATHCRRDLYLHRVPCPCLSADEDAMLNLVASAQAGDDLRLRRRAAGLVHPRAIGALQRYSRILGAALSRLGLRLTDRAPQPWGSAPAMLH
jgi:hypothetical protein